MRVSPHFKAAAKQFFLRVNRRRGGDGVLRRLSRFIVQDADKALDSSFRWNDELKIDGDETAEGQCQSACLLARSRPSFFASSFFFRGIARLLLGHVMPTHKNQIGPR
jgi:hypothetical protein